MNTKKKSTGKRIGVILLAAVLAFVLLAGMFLYQLLSGGLPEVHTDPGEYGQWENFAGYSGLKIFPQGISNDNIQAYYYRSQDTIFSPKAQVFLEAVYPEETFEQEISRLSEVSVSKEGKTNFVLEDVDHFLTDAYVCEYNWNHCYEYALVFPEDRKIEYVFLQNADAEDIKFDNSFLPEDYGNERENNSYCIYGFGIGKNELCFQ